MCVDRIDDWQPRKRISGWKAISMEEEYFRDHFPHFPVLPGVLIIEACVQLTSWLIGASSEFLYSGTLEKVLVFRFSRPAQPGSTLGLCIDCAQWNDECLHVHVEVRTDDRPCANGELRVRLSPSRDRSLLEAEFERMRTSR
jgi:3-hydroxyacyl-[acyl-carrier-protein] dehydratase